MIIIGIAGGTGSGKSTLVKKIVDHLPEGAVAVIPQDSYYKDLSHLPLDVRRQTNFDHPDALEWELFSHQLHDLKSGKPIEQPIYSYVSCTRLEETVHVEPKEIIIIEGILSLHDKSVRDQMDVKVFVDVDADERILRVIQRDIIERGHTLERMIERYRAQIKPMHNQFVDPTKQYADIIIPSNFDKAAQLFEYYIQAILNQIKIQETPST
ncbi:MAG: uridine kinase [Bacteroidaceae bacterium]|nr:uridine kinase [Bacteroidaceae bacterium]